MGKNLERGPSTPDHTRPSSDKEKAPIRYSIPYNSDGRLVSIDIEPDVGWAEVSIQPIGGGKVSVNAGGGYFVEGR